MKELINREIMKPICTKNVMGIELTIYGTVDKPMFKAQDIANILGYADTRRMVGLTLSTEHTVGLLGRQSGRTLFINEMGLYRICIKSDKPAAEPFQTKVAEILVDIRKHGFHATEKTLDNWLSDPDSMIQMIQKYKEEKTLRIAAEKEVQYLSEIINDMDPWLTFASALMKSNKSLLVREVAKLVSNRNFSIGQNQLWKFLRQINVVNTSNEPYQQYMKYFEASVAAIEVDEKVEAYITYRVNVDGLSFIIKMLNKHLNANIGNIKEV